MQYLDPKDPQEVLDYSIDWSADLGDGEALAGTAVWTVPAGLTKDSQEQAGAVTKIWLSVATPGKEYMVTCRVATNNDPPRTYEKTIVIPVHQD